MKKLSNINFFVCSTVLDLKEHRDAVIKKLQASKGVINAQEFFGARNRKPLETCLAEVEKSNVFIVILGNRYGSTTEGDGKSYVEREYEKARSLKLPMLAYLIDESFPVPAKYVETGAGAQQLRTLKEKVKNDLTIETFTDPDDLAGKVFRDLLRVLPDEGIIINKEKAKELEDKSLSHNFFKFISLPKLNYGLEFEIKAELGRIEPANIDECKALSLAHGATIKRHCEILENNELRNLLVEMGSDVFASYDVAQNLIDFPDGSNVILRLKTIPRFMDTDGQAQCLLQLHIGRRN